MKIVLLISALYKFYYYYYYYYYSPRHPYHGCSTDSHVNSIALSVKDQDGELFDFKGMPIEFELEIN